MFSFFRNNGSDVSYGPGRRAGFFQGYDYYARFHIHSYRKVQVGKDQEKAQSEKDSHSKNRGGKKKQTNNQVLIP